MHVIHVMIVVVYTHRLVTGNRDRVFSLFSFDDAQLQRVEDFSIGCWCARAALDISYLCVQIEGIIIAVPYNQWQFKQEQCSAMIKARCSKVLLGHSCLKGSE